MPLIRMTHPDDFGPIDTFSDRQRTVSSRIITPSDKTLGDTYENNPMSRKTKDIADWITPGIGVGLVILAYLRWRGYVELSPFALLGYSLAALFLALADGSKFSREVLEESRYQGGKPKSIRGALLWVLNIRYAPYLQVASTICLVVLPGCASKSKNLTQLNDALGLLSLGVVVGITGVRTIVKVSTMSRLLKRYADDENLNRHPKPQTETSEATHGNHLNPEFF